MVFLRKHKICLQSRASSGPFMKHLSTIGIQRLVIMVRITNRKCQLGSRSQLYILLYFNFSSRTRGGDTPDAPHNHLGTRGPSSMLQADLCYGDRYIAQESTPRSGLSQGLTTGSGVVSRGSYLDVMKSPAQTTRRGTIQSPVVYKYQVCSLILHTLLLAHFCTEHIFALFLSRALPDLSIGGDSPDKFPAPSDRLFVVADNKERHNPVPSCPTFPSSSTWWCLLVG
ncbi:uclacyanin-3-like [Dorcoceras hygrometricum]|uniref:Uclacyanin-3-like n=1 Tax=Dorcoceras hygrometricum TaxID=472368 RepID=A0A2Z7A5D5_9LAMI|nr:uclacyanin-3-like [Dorcoceras hygrometricum]